MTLLFKYLPLITIGLLAGTAAALLLIHLWRPRFAYSWLVAALGALLALPAVFIMRPIGDPGLGPSTLQLGNWESLDMLRPTATTSPGLLLDGVSWSFALALVALVLAVIFTGVARAAESDWSVWAGSLVMAAIGLAAVMAGNPLTMLMLWAAVDIIELLVLLWHIPGSAARERVVAVFSARVGSIFMLWLAMLTAARTGVVLGFDNIPQGVVIYLLLAAGLRLGIIPLHLPDLHEPTLRRGLGTMLRLVPAATSLVLLVRTAAVPLPPTQTLLLLALAVLAACVAAFLWITAANELEGRPFWILGMASLALAAAIRGQPSASLAWGMALLLSGGMLFLTTARHPRLLPGFLLAVLGFSTLPYTAAWNAARMYEDSLSAASAAFMLLFLIPQAMLLAGYARHSLRPGEPLAGVERWVQAIYPAGLLLLPLTHNLAAWLGIGAGAGEMNFWGLSAILPGVAGMALAVLWWLRMRRLPVRPGRIPDGLRALLSLRWMYRLAWLIFGLSGRLANFLTTVLEGEGGVLWALLLLALLLAFFMQSAGGGL